MRLNGRIAKLEKIIKPEKKVHQIGYFWELDDGTLIDQLTGEPFTPPPADWKPGDGIRYIVMPGMWDGLSPGWNRTL